MKILIIDIYKSNIKDREMFISLLYNVYKLIPHNGILYDTIIKFNVPDKMVSNVKNALDTFEGVEYKWI